MPPSAALTLCIALICTALFIESRNRPAVSPALWIPTIWTAIIASRPLVTWFSGSASIEVQVEDGSLIDKLTLSVLIAASLVVLAKRQFQWARFPSENPGLVLVLLYCGVSLLWSDFAAIAFKRWLRALGTIVVILVVLTDKDPLASITTMLRRIVYMLVPLSLLLAKYFPALGVGYNDWTGARFLKGVGTDKNSLGRLCLFAILICLWDFLSSATKPSKSLFLVKVTMASLSVWLLAQSGSATAAAAAAAGAGVLIALRIPFIRQNPLRLGVIAFVSAGIIAALGLASTILEKFVGLLGRDLTLTERVPLWDALLGMKTNWLVGVGYDSFWLGHRLDHFVDMFNVRSAHNGYLEVYLELGIVGALLVGIVVVSALRRTNRLLRSHYERGRLSVVFIVVCLLYNFTESGYKPTTMTSFVFLLFAINLRPLEAAVPTGAGDRMGLQRSASVWKRSRDRRDGSLLPGTIDRRYRPATVGKHAPDLQGTGRRGRQPGAMRSR